MVRKNTISLLIIILSSMLMPMHGIPLVSAGGTIHIRPDGSLDPSNVPISRVGDNIYLFTADIYESIYVERSHIIIDGAGYKLRGDGKGYGFYLANLNNVTIKNTIVEAFACGFYINTSSYITLQRNFVALNTHVGIWLDRSSYNNLTENTMTNNKYNLRIDGADLTEFFHSIDSSNVVNGKPVYYWVSQHNRTVPSDAGYVALINCTNIKVEGLHLSGNGDGLLLIGTHYSVITRNTISNNEFGIGIGESSYNYLSNNVIRANEYYGIRLVRSDYNDVYCNDILGQDIYSESTGLEFFRSAHNNVYGNNITNNQLGFLLYESQDNSIYHNNFLVNDMQVYSRDSINIWDNGYPEGGNYWKEYEGIDEKSGANQDLPGSDGIGDAVYIINYNNRDRYPLMNLWIPVHQPSFRISISPQIQPISARQSVYFNVTIMPVGSFGFPINLTLSYASLDFSLWLNSFSFTPQTVFPPGSSLLTLTASSTLPPLKKIDLIVSASTSYETHSAIASVATPTLEFEISSFRMKQKWFDDQHRAANVYFKFKLNLESVIRPNVNNAIICTDTAEHAGPIFVPHMQLFFPTYMSVNAYETVVGELASINISIGDCLNNYTFTCSSEYISFEIVARFLKANPIFIPQVSITNDNKNLEQWYYFSIDADDALRRFGSNLDEVVVAVLDTGVYWYHPDLQNKIWINEGEVGIDGNGNQKRFNGIDDDNNGYVDDWNGFDFIHCDYYEGKWWQKPWEFPTNSGNYIIGPLDDNSHGTMVAGIIAAEIGNGGMAGIAPNAKIMIVKTHNMEGEEQGIITPQPPFISDSVIEGINYAIKNNADIICLSFGTYVMLNNWKQKIDDAYKQGITIIAGIGNDMTSNPFYPASFDKVVSVSGLFSIFLDRLCFYDEMSNYGPSVENCKESAEISAPAYNILSTNFTITGSSILATWGRESGTSFSTPQVAAVSALVIGYARAKYDRSLNPAEVRFILHNSAIDIGPQDWDFYHGFGQVNAYKALQKVDELIGQHLWRVTLDPNDDLDLHVFDPIGKHVGLNYETKALDIEILGAVHTGDDTGGFENIFLPANLTDFETRIIAINVSETATYTLIIEMVNEEGKIIQRWALVGEIKQGQIDYYTITLTAFDKPTIISWEYVYEDMQGKGTKIKISTDDDLFQFITSEKNYGVREATYMRQCGRAILIRHYDGELRLITVAVDTKLDFCVAIAWDLLAHKKYFLIDKVGEE